MSPNDSETNAARPAVEPITDPRSLRVRDDVPVHDETPLVDAETVDLVADLEDMAVAGVTNDRGAVLVRKLTPDCDWKLPVATVATDEDFTAAARAAVEGDLGVGIEFDAIEGLWHHEVRVEDGDRTATRDFVVFSARPADETDRDRRIEGAAGDGPAGMEWVTELPEDAQRLPGTDLFLD